MLARLFFYKEPLAIHKIGVHLSNLESGSYEPLDLFEDGHVHPRKTMDAVDRINDRYGEQVVYIGSMHEAKGRTGDSISFGSTGIVKALHEEEEQWDVKELDNELAPFR